MMHVVRFHLREKITKINKFNKTKSSQTQGTMLYFVW